MSYDEDRTVLIPGYIGAGAGFLAFLVFGAIPGLLYGGYMGLTMAGALFGTPVEPTLAAKILTFGGMLLGLVTALFLFLVLGAFLGTLVGMPFVLVRASAGARPEAEDSGAANPPAGRIVSEFKEAMEGGEEEAQGKRKVAS